MEVDWGSNTELMGSQKYYKKKAKQTDCPINYIQNSVWVISLCSVGMNKCRSGRHSHFYCYGDNIMKELSTGEITQVSGGDACTTAFQAAGAVWGTAHGALLGPGGALAGFGFGVAVGDVVAGYVCS